MRIITVSREFGSGGRELARRLADALSFSYYDQEIIEEIAAQEKLDAGYVARTLDAGLRWNMPIHYARSFAVAQPAAGTAQLLAAQHRIIRRLAPKGDCVIVGRGADAVLREYRPFRVFVYADDASRIARCLAHRRPDEADMTERELARRIRQIDRNRAAAYELIASTAWGDRRGYDLCVNTTNLNIKEITPLLAAYAEQWFRTREK